MCSLASQTCRRTGLLNCCHGIGTIRTCRWSLELGIMLYAIRGPRRVLSAKRKALAQNHPDLIEQALLEYVERCERGELSVEECAAIADKLADAAKQHLRRAQELAEIARKMRPPGWNPPHAPR